MMKSIRLWGLLLALLLAVPTLGQIRMPPCPTCGKKVNLCPYHGKHPKPKPQPKPTAKPKPKPKPQSQSQQVQQPQPQPQSQVQPQEPQPQVQAAYEVTFTCNVPSATMYIDGTNYGNPSGTRYLKTDTHRVRLTADGYEDYEGTFAVGPNSTAVSLTMTQRAQPLLSDETITVNGVSFVMKGVQGGTFRMGSNDSEAGSDEKPVHQVTVSSFRIGQTEVTQELWKAVMGTKPSFFKGAKRPVEQVSWTDCQQFIQRLNAKTGKQFRLPTEAEWEYAARGGNQSRGNKYAGSSSIDAVAWYGVNSFDKGSKSPDYGTHAVGTKQPNELGLYDMTGNVCEWCSDWYGEYSSNSQTNPAGPSSGSYRVHRGGSWASSARDCRVSDRGLWMPDNRNGPTGLRLAL
ncbi:MAG: SUMF1/EgtB/PvdO family nonheme iron enzyme [Prevotella sp.]|nr:SUMF1/EgtB/PvdO family nonheme iron enzyme [Prevotella sp.]